MIRTCGMSRRFRETGTLTHGTYEDAGAERCGNPLPPEQWDRGPWMCDACQAQSRRRSQHPSVHRDVTPAVADVLRVMREEGVGQDEAVRRLGGKP